MSDEQATRIATLETLLLEASAWVPTHTTGGLDLHHRISAALVPAPEPEECPTCGDDCSARTVTLPDGTIADCSEPKPAPKGKGWMADLFAAHPPPKLGDKE
jgi:hypothetical protein